MKAPAPLAVTLLIWPVSAPAGPLSGPISLPRVSVGDFNSGLVGGGEKRKENQPAAQTHIRNRFGIANKTEELVVQIPLQPRTVMAVNLHWPL